MAELAALAGALATVAGAAIAALTSYLLVLTGAALIRRPAPAARSTPGTRFAILVPAHDEALVIERLLESLRAQRYPRDKYDIHVVADNCRDETAVLAARAGAVVHERTDEQHQAKGYALRWILSILSL